MQLRITKAEVHGTSDSFRSDRYVLHKSVMQGYPRAVRSQLAANFPRFKTRGNWPVLPRLTDAKALVLNALSSRGYRSKNSMAAPQKAEYAFDTEDHESSAKIVKFVILKKHEEQDATQGHELASFEEAMLPHLDAAHNLARWLLRNEQDAQDVVQEAYLRAFRSFGGFHGSNGRAWLLTIVRNTSYTLLKKNRAVDLTTTFDEEIHATDHDLASPAAILEQAEDTELIRNAVDELPVEFREILILRHLERLSYKEIGEILKIPTGTVMSRLARGRARLKEYLTTQIGKEK